MKLHTGDTVVIISGKDKGKTGTILRVLAGENRVVVTGVNIRTKHVKKTAQEAGRILKYEADLHASNVMIIDPKTKKRTRMASKVDAKGHKVRISTKSGEVIVKVAAAKTLPKKKDDAKAKSKDKETAADPVQKSQPFWKKVKFSGPAGEAPGNVNEPSRGQKDQSIPDQQLSTFTRSGGRGS